MYVQSLFAKDNTVTPIQLGACYHSSYGVEQLVGEVDLYLHVTAKDASDFSLQNIYTITHQVACIWELEQPANSELSHTIGLNLQANSSCCFSLALHLFVKAKKDNNPQLYLPLAAFVAHFMWYPPKVCSSGAVGFAGRCLKHFCRLAYQAKVSLPACYSYMEDVLLNCLTIGSAFSACGGWGSLVSEGNLCLPLYSWTGMSRNSQLAWCQMLVALDFVCNQTESNKYKLVAPLVPLCIKTSLHLFKLSFHPPSSHRQCSFYKYLWQDSR
ncbi:hypothetical protein DSO57_1013560 [Entomophthora muscae]|uniref:Uncharacterized protein n=1 Tax=Entomophthora muscae TaxID=34485 RepID=A0ACC2RKI7_9FUNG|nr:hypothetical protein DSO57_1013560 [Entomophthora muscae]